LVGLKNIFYDSDLSMPKMKKKQVKVSNQRKYWNPILKTDALVNFESIEMYVENII
jgi:hypothetical protein